MGLRGVLISRGDVRGHLTFLGTKDRSSGVVSCSLNRNRVFSVVLRVYSICRGEKKRNPPPFSVVESTLRSFQVV